MADKIIVTGGCGFIGREVVAQLVARGADVTVVDDLSKPESAAPPGARFLRQDLTDTRGTRPAFAGFKHCIHLAAKIGGIGYFHRHPATILAENDKIYSSVFEACAHHKYERIVYISSSMVFEKARQFPSRESDLHDTPAPLSAYGFSKLSGEWYCRAFKDEFGLPYSIVRPFNAYGVNEAPGEEVGEAHVIPDLAKKILECQDPLEILGDGQQTRCFTHVSDIARGILAVLDSPRAACEDFNISSPDEVRMLDLARMIWELIRGRDAPLRIKHVPGFKHDVQRRAPDVEKARRLLGFEAKVRLEDKLPEVVAYVKDVVLPRLAARRV
ncbi:NAD-dependent epimerase/dehydratase family protein [bacterium]|nr:NAD-dependent epimerase/dehydratase family protein [bacterium]